MKMILVIASFMLLAVHSVHGQCTEVVNCGTCEDRGPECISCAADKVLSNDKQSCLDCPDNCGKCEREGDTDELVCLECESGYLKDGECADCELENCKTCTKEGETETCTKCDDAGYSLSGGKCTGCPTGKYLDGTSCKGCPSNAVSCTAGPTVSACVKEGESYVKAGDAKSCIKCNGCVKCELDDTTAKCTECAENQYLMEDGTCSLCAGDSTADDNCKTCGDDGVCTECNKEYYLKDGECANCPANCDECSEDDTAGLICGTCSTKYGLNDEVICEKCSSNCITCSDANTCSACDEGYTVVSNACKACPTKCKLCNSDETTCTSCIGDADLGINADGDVQCYDLPTGCTGLITTSPTGATYPQCDACSAGYGLDSADNQCKVCDGTDVPGCLTCTAASGTVTCAADAPGATPAVVGCKPGYAQYTDSGAKKCALCNQVTNCKECTAADATTITCTACADGYGVTGSGAAAACYSCTTGLTGAFANCKTCTLASATALTSCDTCDDGMALNTAASACVSCSSTTTNAIANCKTCTVSAADAIATCTACNDGYTAEGTTACALCNIANCDTAGCAVKSGSAFCDTCKAGYRQKYVTNALDGTCTKCTGNCDVCSTKADGTQQCTDCADFFNLANEACEACPTNCITCSDAQTCTTCEDGYGKNADNSGCIACIAECKTCDANGDGENVCTDCKSKYFEENDDCVSCPTNCLECTYNAGVMECGKCADGYVLNGGVCDKCPSNCQECSSATKCKTGKCNAGYAVEANECQACATLTGIANCALCSEKPDTNSSAPCLACTTGFVLKDNLQSGDGAECVSATGLTCQGGASADRPFQCDEGKCTGETTQTSENLCGRQCYVCGDYDKKSFVAAEDCKTDNATGVVALCPSGFCAMLSRTVDGKNVVAGGCLPVTDECKTPDDVDCNSINEGEAKLTECSKCCDENLCLQGDLTTGLKEGNLAPANSANLLVLVSCSIGALTLLLPRA